MVVVKTVLDENVTKEINKEQFRKLNKFMIVMILILAAIGVIGILVDEMEAGIFLLVFAVLYFPLIKVIAKVNQKKVNKTMSVMSSETEETYIFDDEQIQIELVKGNDYSSIVKTNYSYLYQVVETDENFFLYVSKMQMHVVPKNKIIEGSVSELKNIFARNLKEKYKVKLSKKVNGL